MVKVEIKPSQVSVDVRNGVSAKSGKPYTMREQMGYAWLGGDYPELIKLSLDEGQPPYTAGFYELLLSSFRVGDFNRLQVDRVRLSPIDVK